MFGALEVNMGFKKTHFGQISAYLTIIYEKSVCVSTCVVDRKCVTKIHHEKLILI